jgi:hypothetical protein
MGQQSLELVVRHLRRLASRNGVAELSDAQLLERFAIEREELAFALLMQRHGPWVLQSTPQSGHHLAPRQTGLCMTGSVRSTRVMAYC